MTQEQKDLLIKDLCARLPYGVKCKDVTIDFIGTMTDISRHDNMCKLYNDYGDNYTCFMANCKPYLLPLSRMNEEQLKEMQEIIGNPNEACISVNTSGLELWLNSVDTYPTIWLDTIFEVQDWLNKNHFDYHNLIEKGLAIDCTNLNIY